MVYAAWFNGWKTEGHMTPTETNWMTPSNLLSEMSIRYRWDRRSLNKKFNGTWWLPLQQLIAEGKVKVTLVGVTLIYEANA
jgi:hypothetical protein